MKYHIPVKRRTRTINKSCKSCKSCNLILWRVFTVKIQYFEIEHKHHKSTDALPKRTDYLILHPFESINPFRNRMGFTQIDRVFVQWSRRLQLPPASNNTHSHRPSQSRIVQCFLESNRSSINTLQYLFERVSTSLSMRYIFQDFPKNIPVQFSFRFSPSIS